MSKKYFTRTGIELRVFAGLVDSFDLGKIFIKQLKEDAFELGYDPIAYEKRAVGFIEQLKEKYGDGR